MSDDSHKPRSGFLWPKDYFARGELLGCLLAFPLPLVVLGVILSLLLPLVSKLQTTRPKSVILYTSQDQQFAEPILKRFAKETGIKVRAIYDSEAVKTVGLANRLLAETNHPQCDVWWSNEALRTHQLAARGVFTNGIGAFGFRSRRIVINTNKLTLATAPTSLLELTNVQWRGKVALAYPMFGTTSAHFIALRRYWGATNWETWCRALATNKPFLVDGNSVVVKLVGRGEAWIGLTDSDDIAAGQEEKLPIAAGPITLETLLIPNTVAVVRGCPRPMVAQQLFQFLQRHEVINELIALHALEGSTPGPRPHLDADWSALVNDLESSGMTMKAVFLR